MTGDQLEDIFKPGLTNNPAIAPRASVSITPTESMDQPMIRMGHLPENEWGNWGQITILCSGTVPLVAESASSSRRLGGR